MKITYSPFTSPPDLLIKDVPYGIPFTLNGIEGHVYIKMKNLISPEGKHCKMVDLTDGTIYEESFTRCVRDVYDNADLDLGSPR